MSTASLHLGPPASRRPGPGFTLMEVMAAVVLVAIVLPVAMHGLSVAASLAGTARDKAQAAVLAHSKMSELLVTKEWQTGVLNDAFGAEHPAFRWTAELSDWDASALKQLDVRVHWISRGQEQVVTVSTLVDTESY